MFGGRGFPYGGDRWPDWSQVAAYWLQPDDTLLPAWDRASRLAEQDLIPDSREAALSEWAPHRTPMSRDRSVRCQNGELHANRKHPTKTQPLVSLRNHHKNHAE